VAGATHNPRGNDDLERVKDATDIVRLVGEHVALKPKGREYVGLCPFHEDHNPSMYVVPAKQMFHCFVCGAGGDCFAFVKRLHKMEFREALEFLAERANITLTPRKHREEPAPGEEGTTTRRDLLAACATAADFFRVLLRHPEHGVAGRAVIERRGISPEMLEQFSLGVAADRWDGLLSLIRSKGLRERDFAEAGLLKPRDSGGMYDAFRNRLMFPIHDAAGRVVAFGGRKINEADEPKYINSPETRLFNKSQTLYGLHQAARAIQQERTALITEGYTDTIACHQAGIRHAVATLGTALTREHAGILGRYAQRIVLLFDGDDAGQRAADRAVEVFFAEPVDVAICTLSSHTDAKDPDELLKRPGGADILRGAIAQAADLIDYRFARLRSRLAGSGTGALARAINEEIARLIELGLADLDPIKQRLVIRRLAALAELPEETIREQAARQRGGSRRVARAEARDEDDNSSRVLLPAAEAVLGSILVEGGLIERLTIDDRARLREYAYRSPHVAQLAQIMLDLADEGIAPSMHATLARLHESEAADDVVSAATTLAARTDTQTQGHADRLAMHLTQSLVTFRSEAAPTPRGLDLASAIELKRKQHADTGGDRRVLPGVRTPGRNAPGGGTP